MGNPFLKNKLHAAEEPLFRNMFHFIWEALFENNELHAAWSPFAKMTHFIWGEHFLKIDPLYMGSPSF